MISPSAVAGSGVTSYNFGTSTLTLNAAVTGYFGQNIPYPGFGPR